MHRQFLYHSLLFIRTYIFDLNLVIWYSSMLHVLIFYRKEFAIVPDEDGLVPVPHDLPHFPHKVGSNLIPLLIPSGKFFR